MLLDESDELDGLLDTTELDELLGELLRLDELDDGIDGLELDED